MTFADFCCGAGGLSLGLVRAGFSHVLGIDADRFACRTYQANVGPVECRDLRLISDGEWRGLGVACDLWAAGLPCQPFSTMGKRLGTADPRDLFPTFLAGVAHGRPKWVLIENVPQVRRWHDPAAELARLGYRSWEGLVRACDFGLPQRRARWICVATSTDAHFEWPTPTHSGDWSRPGIGTQRTPAASEVAPSIPVRGFVTVTASDGKRGRRSSPAWRRPSHLWERIGRLPDPQETSALQGFPDSWCWPSSREASCRLIGNAVPPPLAEALGRCILAAASAEVASGARERA